MQVSVIMPAYNAERYVVQAVESVLSQTHADFEFIVVDDGSEDGTAAILESYARKDRRVKVFSQPNRGLVATLNRGLDLARNEWVVRMDADDVMLPHRIERQVAFVRENPDLGVASSLVYYIDGEGRGIGRYQTLLTDRGEVQEFVRRGRLIAFHHPAAIMRRSVVAEAGGYREAFWPAEDIDLWNRIVERGHGVLVQPEYLLRYRKHASSTSIARTRVQWLKTAWVKACVQRRRAGRPEISWETFLEDRRNRPWWARLDQERKDLAKVLYDVSVFYYSVRRYHAFVPTLLGAAALQPGFTLPRVVSRFAGRDAAEMPPGTAG